MKMQTTRRVLCHFKSVSDMNHHTRQSNTRMLFSLMMIQHSSKKQEVTCFIVIFNFDKGHCLSRTIKYSEVCKISKTII